MEEDIPSPPIGAADETVNLDNTVSVDPADVSVNVEHEETSDQAQGMSVAKQSLFMDGYLSSKVNSTNE